MTWALYLQAVLYLLVPAAVDGGQRFLELSKSVEISTVCFVT